uniref:Basement membrane-specific heparan sulfate proteoglycan core protein n=1 Tax=Neogobius melanostomus TaxID=47308 RepID=A0A8C6UKU4_9GOBI
APANYTGLMMLNGAWTCDAGSTQNALWVYGLFPAVLNLATMADITANATCGVERPEMSCKLVEHVPGQPVRNTQCSLCNQQSTKPSEQHPIDFAIDGTNRWWQSPSIQNGMKYHYVTITLDLNQVNLLINAFYTFPIFLRPSGNWVLERSIDGVTFDPWQYYAMSDTECLTRFNITPRRGPPSYRRDDEVICTSFYSKIHPLENGEIHTSLINGRPSADDPSPKLLNFTSARYIRLVFKRIKTLNADLMTLTLRDAKEIDSIVTRRYYYSIKDISVGGMCICYGHAKACPLDAQTKKFSCECEHNTCGESCDQCCPGYNQQPWMAGTYIIRHVCEKCNCHGKAEECYYNQTVADLSLSLDTHGEYRGGGVCVGCRDNTDGVNCQSCARGFYRPGGVDPEEDNPCVPCSCDSVGALSQWCVPDVTQATHGTQLIHICSSHISFPLCAVGYKDYPSCQRCNCSLEGSTNEDPCVSPCVCKGNVEGENCDRCKLGFYNLHRGNRRGCDKCACMGVSSQCTGSTWAYRNVRQCVRTGNCLITQTLPVSYTVSLYSFMHSLTVLLVYWKYKCVFVFQSCASGFRRVNGVLYNGFCEACQCHGHSSQCDEVTGHCLGCLDLTTGPFCDTCLPGYYGNATWGSPTDCQPCACPLNLPSNNFSPTCHMGAGGEVLCDQCPPGYTGPRCDRCSNGYYGQPAVPGGSCQPCECHGNLDLSLPESCHPITGQCLRCRPGYGGVACDTCTDGYYGDAVTAKNCQPCQCHTNGSVSEVCHQQTGQCECRENVVGRQCDECVPETHGISTGGMCIPCHCNSFGSKSFDCDESGQCRCQPGVSGPKCDRCSRGFFNFQEGGCTREYSPTTVYLPPNTMGERCDRCAPNHWGHEITIGCKECGCNAIGSVSQQCNVNTGCCQCRENFRGEKCNECQIGYRDFPQCIQCHCNVAGSDCETCDLERGVCGCADRTGKCSCKVNVKGDHCDQCKVDTFGLSMQNPLGCSRCYCYGLTHTCTEAPGLIRMWLTLRPEQTVLPLVDRSNTLETRRGVSFQHPEILAHSDQVTSVLSEPYYWKLPEQFRGSMITAYGGQLKYAVYYEARDETGPSSYEPQVIIKGGPNHNMIMGRHTPGLQIGQLTRHQIDMTEHEWKFADGRTMTREDFMDILFYVDYILIKASHGNLMRHSRISEITLTVAEEGRPTKESEEAHQIEKCDCPQGYSGLSCEECAAGFYRLRSGSVAPVPASRAPTAAGMGSCVQCQCSGHSSTCDPDTSICQDCQDNTAGDHCERCAPGFYGIVQGFPDDCKPCACPLLNPENNFSPTCVTEGYGDYRCTACPEGYEGKHCERCATGYHGNPLQPGGRCEECKCSEWGSLPGPCDPVTGQCRCRTGPQGGRVTSAWAGMSCDDECSGLLISDMERLYKIITEVTLRNLFPLSVQELEEMQAELDPLHGQLDAKVSRLTDGLGGGRLASHVTEAEDYAKQLNESAAILDSILAEAKNLSFNATAAFKAYSNIKANVDAAEKEAKAAKQGAAEALALVRPKNISYTAARVAATKAVAAGANATAIDVLERLGELNLQIKGLQKNYGELEDTVNAANQLIQDPEKNIHAAGAKVKDLEDKADRLLEKLQPIKTLQDNLHRNISQIKELISQARKQANSIKVSVSSGGDCLRSYRPEIRKGRYNTIILHVKTTTPDNLLFYLGSAQYVDFLALEMRTGTVNFLWDVGSGVGRVAYPLLTIHDGNWHRIEASRKGLTGTIAVYPLEGPNAGMMATPVSADAPKSFTILDVDQNAYLFVGGIIGTVKKADAVRSSTFEGCMGETFLDGKPIGLWNYRERQGDCKGCVSSPHKSDGEGIVQLDGEGYGTVGRPTRWNPNMSSITFKFRTFSSDALLMYLATLDMMDFMSLELSEGKVKLNFDLGSGVGSAISNKRLNDGRWKSLTVSRNKKQATVTIVDIDSGAEERILAVSPGSATGLNLKENQKIYFGGLPTIGNYRPEVTLKRYAGCLREIEVSRSPYNLLSSFDYTGVTKGCSVDNLYTVSFSKAGYMELAGLSLGIDTELSLSFSTLEDTGTVLLAVGGTNPNRKRHYVFMRLHLQPYLSVMLNKGSLEVLLFSGTHTPLRVVRRPEQGILHDGQEHSLRIERLPRRMFAVQVDEEPKREVGLPNDQPMVFQRVFLGAFLLKWSRRPTGSILSDFSQPVSFVNADIGRCPSLAPAPPPLPPCCPTLEQAYQFGLSRNSHMSFTFDDTKVRERLILEFELRTKESSGLVLYMARINHADFVTIQIKEGQVCLGYDLGHGNISACVPFSINDGNWHKIRVNRQKQRGTLSVDMKNKKQLTSPKEADLLDVVGVVYMGGLPQNYTTKRIGPILYSLNGCIRNFKMQGNAVSSPVVEFRVDMQNPSSSHMVGRCFVSTEPGTFFQGTGYLKAVATYRVGQEVSIAFDFRTSRTNGVLLGVSNKDKDGLGIELVDGKLLFHVDNGAGLITAEVAPEGEGFCDGQWHSVTATKIKHRIELRVDGTQSNAESPNARSNTCETKDPIYVGGYPPGAHQAALSSRRSFKGCMKELRITKASKTLNVQFNKALEVKGVQPMSCPAPVAA